MTATVERTAEENRAYARALATHEWRLRQPSRKMRRRMTIKSRRANRGH